MLTVGEERVRGEEKEIHVEEERVHGGEQVRGELAHGEERVLTNGFLLWNKFTMRGHGARAGSQPIAEAMGRGLRKRSPQSPGSTRGGPRVSNVTQERTLEIASDPTTTARGRVGPGSTWSGRRPRLQELVE